jgi:peptide/nickel transport system permease protein
MRMRDYIIRRLILLLPVLLGVSMLTFTLSHLIGDPVAAYVTSEKISEERIQLIIKAHGLDKPIYIQYLYYLRDLLRGDWGISRSDSNRPVVESIRNYFPATLELTIVAMSLSLLMGIPIGIISATKKDKPIDHVVRVFALTGVSMPVFWLGLLLQYIFYYQFKVHGLPYLPLSQRIDPFVAIQHPIKQLTGLLLLDSLISLNPYAFKSALEHIIMPAFCLSYVTLALIARMMRASMLEVLRQDYIILARSKGLPEKIVIYKHALRNAMIPTVTVAGLAFGGLLSGAVLTETVFAWPGVGRWSTQAILTSDIGGIMGFTLLIAIIYVLANLIVDVLYAILDPRIRLG